MDVTQRTHHIIYSHYKTSDLRKVASEGKHLSEGERVMLHNLLIKRDLLFNETLSICKTKPVDIEIHTYAKPYHYKLHPVPRAHQTFFNK